MADGESDGLIDVPALERFLAERVPGNDAPLECERHVVGSSNVTYYVTRGRSSGCCGVRRRGRCCRRRTTCFASTVSWQRYRAGRASPRR